MKVVYTFIISILLFGCSSTLVITNDLKKLKLKGNVKRLISKERKKNDTVYLLNKIYVFNKKGNTTTENYFKNDTVSISKPSTKTIYTYTKFGKRKVKKQYESNGDLYREENYKYNSKKKLIRKSRFDGNGDPLFVWLHTYNNKKERTETTVRDVSYGGSTLDKSTFKYNNKGNRIKTENYDNNGELHSIYSYIFKNNNLTKAKLIFFINGIITTKINSYDIKGNKIDSKLYDKNNHLATVFNTIYDENNNPIETLYIKNNLEEKTTFKYQYDLYNNWTYQEVRVNDKLKIIRLRDIEYFTK